MTDIVDRLRWRAENSSAPTATTPMLCAEAADTITALRAEVERLAGIVDGFTLDPDYIRLTARVAELEEALKAARPFIGWAGHYPTILAQVDAALTPQQGGE